MVEMVERFYKEACSISISKEECSVCANVKVQGSRASLLALLMNIMKSLKENGITDEELELALRLAKREGNKNENGNN